MNSRVLALICLLCAACISSAFASSPRISYRLESNAIFAAPEGGNAVQPLVPAEWEKSYLHEFRVYLNGKTSDNVGYRVEPRFFYSYTDDSTEEFDWVLDRGYAYIDFSDHYTFLAGKQRIRWGTGLTYNPTDRWQAAPNALDPTRYLEGVYLFRFDAYLPFATATVVYAPSRPEVEYRAERDEVVGARLFKLIGTVDLYASVTHNLRNETNIGGAFSWDAGPVVIYGEGAYLKLANGSQQAQTVFHDKEWRPRVVLGSNRQLGSNGSIYLEAYYNEWGLTTGEFDFWRRSIEYTLLLAEAYPDLYPDGEVVSIAEITTPARSLHQLYIAGNGSYVYLDTWGFAGNVIVEPIDGTLYLYPLLSYLGFQSAEMTLGWYSVTGTDRGEAAILPSHHALDFRFIVHF